MHIQGVHVETRKGCKQPAIQSRSRAKETVVMPSIDCRYSGKRTRAVYPTERVALSKERIDNSRPTRRTQLRASTTVSGHEETRRPPRLETETQECPCRTS